MSSGAATRRGGEMVGFASSPTRRSSTTSWLTSSPTRRSSTASPPSISGSCSLLLLFPTTVPSSKKQQNASVIFSISICCYPCPSKQDGSILAAAGDACAYCWDVVCIFLRRLVNVKSHSRGMLIICTALQFVSQTARL